MRTRSLGIEQCSVDQGADEQRSLDFNDADDLALLAYWVDADREGAR